MRMLSPWFQALRFRIEIVLPLPPKLEWQRCVTNNRGSQGYKDVNSNRSNVIFWCSAKEATIYKWLSFDLNTCAVVIIYAERGPQIHGIRPLIRLTVGDVHRTLCKQKQTSLLYVRRMVRETRQIPFWTCLLQQIGLKHFKIIRSVSNYWIAVGEPSRKILGFHVTSSVFKIKNYQFFWSFSFIRYKSLKELDVLQRLSLTGFFVLL